MKSLTLIVLAASLLCACASYQGRTLQPGMTTLADVERVMGPPALRWPGADGSLKLAYPRGPQGYHTWMVQLAPDGKLRDIRNVLEPKSFGAIRPGMTQGEVLFAIGPSPAHWTQRFPARHELVWEWRWCNNIGEPSRFDVIFDEPSGRVRSTLTQTEDMIGLNGMSRGHCSR